MVTAQKMINKTLKQNVIFLITFPPSLNMYGELLWLGLSPSTKRSTHR